MCLFLADTWWELTGFLGLRPRTNLEKILAAWSERPALKNTDHLYASARHEQHLEHAPMSDLPVQ